MDAAFQVHKLNDAGFKKAQDIAEAFDALILKLAALCSTDGQGIVIMGREFSIVRTKLEEACFFAKKAMANVEANQAKDSAA